MGEWRYSFTILDFGTAVSLTPRPVYPGNSRPRFYLLRAIVDWNNIYLLWHGDTFVTVRIVATSLTTRRHFVLDSIREVDL
jgi:hypothetical protein